MLWLDHRLYIYIMPHINDFSGVYQINTLSIENVSGLKSRLDNIDTTLETYESKTNPLAIPKLTLYYKLRTAEDEIFGRHYGFSSKRPNQ